MHTPSVAVCRLKENVARSRFVPFSLRLQVDQRQLRGEFSAANYAKDDLPIFKCSAQTTPQ